MAVKWAAVCMTLSVVLLGSVAVDKNNFKTCDQSSFCRYVLEEAIIGMEILCVAI